MWVSVSAAAVLLGACGQAAAPRGNADVAPAAAAAQAQVTLTATELDGLGQVLTDQDGLTLYRFDEDTADPPASTCTDACAANWPPVVADGDVQASGFDENAVGTVARPDGTQQVTVGGWPIYRFAGDTAAGQANGQSVGGTWFAVAPDGTKAGQEQPAEEPTEEPTEEPAAEPVSLVGTALPGFGPAITDQDGRTLYLFTNDSKDPAQSTCNGDCAANWPPVLADGDVAASGLTSPVGTVTRDDGTQQVTVGGWPVYYYAGDSAAGDTNGHGVGGNWFVIEPAGCKSEVPVAEEPAEEPETGGAY